MVAIQSLGRLSGRSLPPVSWRIAAPVAAGLAGVATAGVVAGLPSSLLDPLLWHSGLPAIMPAAAPPLGAAGRTIIALLAGGLVSAPGALPWLVARRPAASGDGPVVRRADAHPDAPPRRPIRATEDLGPPLPARAVPPRVRALPADLDQPLAAFDPAALPETPREPVRAVAALAPPQPKRPSVIDPGERFETFALPAPPGDGRAAPATTIAALLDRLERGTTRRAPVATETPSARAASLDETLGMLRRLATG